MKIKRITHAQEFCGNRLSFPACLAFAILMVAHPVSSAVLIFQDNYDDDPAGPGVANYSFFGGQITDVSTVAFPNYSAPHSAQVTLNFGLPGFGGGFIRDTLLTPINLSGDTYLSVRISSSIDFTPLLGVVGFRLVDADGTVYRTQTADLYRPTGTFTEFRQPVSAINFEDAPGSTPGLDLSNIVSYGLLFFDRGDFGGVAGFNIDDFTGTAIPEPGALVLFSLGLLGLKWLRRSPVRKRILYELP